MGEATEDEEEKEEEASEHVGVRVPRRGAERLEPAVFDVALPSFDVRRKLHLVREREVFLRREHLLLLALDPCCHRHLACAETDDTIHSGVVELKIAKIDRQRDFDKLRFVCDVRDHQRSVFTVHGSLDRSATTYDDGREWFERISRKVQPLNMMVFEI